jgi:hypothetical protein
MSDQSERQRLIHEQAEAKRRALIEKHQAAWAQQETRLKLQRQHDRKVARQAGESGAPTASGERVKTWNEHQKDRA